MKDAEIERLQGSGLAVEMVLGITLRILCDHPTRTAIADGIGEIPDALSRRYGLESKPDFKRGIEDAIENISSHLRRD